jgi:hypothetical protein
MRNCILFIVLVIAACKRPGNVALPPLGQFYSPSGVAHVAHGDAGILVVANANSDKRYQTGSVVAVDLDAVSPPMPPFGGTVNDAGVLVVSNITALNIAEDNRALISSFAGELAPLKLSNSHYRYFVPSRSEGMKLNGVELNIISGKAVMKCHSALNEGPGDGGPSDCSEISPTLTPNVFEQSAEGIPRAPSPYGANVKVRTCATKQNCGAETSTCENSVCVSKNKEPEADVFVTHQLQADSPLGSQTNYRSYLVKVDTDTMAVNRNSFIDMGPGATNSSVSGSRFTYVSGRFNTNGNTVGSVVRFVDSVQLPDGGFLAFNAGIENTVSVPDSRGIDLSPDETRLYVASRSPNVLLTLSVTGAQTDFPSILPIRTIALPSQPNEVRVISRGLRAPLVAITCSAANLLALYDDELGRVVAEVPLGTQPYGLRSIFMGTGARLFVTNFGDGRVAVVDVPDLMRAESARVVAYLGEKQTCIVQGPAYAGCGGPR